MEQPPAFIPLGDEAVEDVPRRHRVTAKLTAERERDAIAASLKNVLESTTDGLVVLDRQGRYTYANEQAAKIVAQRPADMIGKTQWELFPHASGA